MKKSKCIIIVLFFLSNSLFAQQKIERYCEVSVQDGGRHLSGLNIDSGNIKKEISIVDSTNNIELNAIKENNSIASLLNYMSKRGWTLINSIYAYNRKIYYFKKDM